MMKAILFDFGGTLDTDGIHWSEKFWDKYKLLNIPIQKKKYEEAYVYSENNVSSLIFQTDNLQATLKKQVDLQLEYLVNNNEMPIDEKEYFSKKISFLCYEDVLSNIEAVKNILKYLYELCKLGVVSNYYGNLTSVLYGLKILKYFDVIIDSRDVGIKKPNPQIFQEAISSLKINPTDVFVVGDSYDRDIRPAKSLNCTTIWLDGRSWNKPQNIIDADIIIHSLTSDLISTIVDEISYKRNRT